MNHLKRWLVAGMGVAVFLLAVPSVSYAWQDEEETAKEEISSKEAKKALEEKACDPKKTKHKARTDKKQHPTPEPPAGQALVYVVRPTRMGQKIQTKLAVDGKFVGGNRGNNYFYFTLDPGEHYFCSQAENRSLLTLTVEAGQTYYLQQKIKMGLWKARNKLVELTEEKGKKALAKTHLSIFEEKN